MTTPQTKATRRTDYEVAIQALSDANALSFIPGVFRRAAMRIGQYGWRSASMEGHQGAACCIWLAVDTEMDASFGNPNTPLRGQAFTVVIGYMTRHFGVRHLREVFDLNDKQPEYEGQSWAMYHLSTMAEKFRRDYNL